MNLERAIKLLESEYERAKKLEWIRNPVAYALHKVWRMADLSNDKDRRTCFKCAYARIPKSKSPCSECFAFSKYEKAVQ